MIVRRWIWPARVAVTALLLAAFLLSSPWLTFQYILSVNPLALSLSLVLVVPLGLVKGLRWYVILRGMGQQVRLRTALGGYWLAMGAGSVTPGQLGDLSKAWYLKSQGVPLRFGLVSSLLDRVLDVTLVLVLLIWVVLTWGILGEATIAVSGALLIATVILGLFFTSRGFRMATLGRWGPLLSRVAAVGKLVPALNSSLDTGVYWPHMLLGAGLTVLGYGIGAMRVQLLIWGIGEELSVLQGLSIATLASGASLLPITMAGVGTRDLALMLYVAALGKSPSLGIALSMLVLALNLSSVLLGLATSLWIPFRLPGNHEALDGA